LSERSGPDHTEELIDASVDTTGEMTGHGGGDGRLIADFISVVKGNEPSKSVTNVQDSLTGHLIAYAADTAMREHRVVEMV